MREEGSWLGNRVAGLFDGEVVGIIVGLTKETTNGLFNGHSDSVREGLENGSWLSNRLGLAGWEAVGIRLRRTEKLLLLDSAMENTRVMWEKPRSERVFTWYLTWTHWWRACRNTCWNCWWNWCCYGDYSAMVLEEDWCVMGLDLVIYLLYSLTQKLSEYSSGTAVGFFHGKKGLVEGSSLGYWLGMKKLSE